MIPPDRLSCSGVMKINGGITGKPSMFLWTPQAQPCSVVCFVFTPDLHHPGEKIAASAKFGQVWCGVSGGKKNWFSGRGSGKNGSPNPPETRERTAARGFGSAGRGGGGTANWLPRVTGVTGSRGEATPVQRRKIPLRTSVLSYTSSSVHSFHQYVLSIYYVPGTRLGAEPPRKIRTKSLSS